MPQARSQGAGDARRGRFGDVRAWKAHVIQGDGAERRERERHALAPVRMPTDMRSTGVPGAGCMMGRASARAAGKRSSPEARRRARRVAGQVCAGCAKRGRRGAHRVGQGHGPHVKTAGPRRFAQGRPGLAGRKRSRCRPVLDSTIFVAFDAQVVGDRLSINDVGFKPDHKGRHGYAVGAGRGVAEFGSAA